MKQGNVAKIDSLMSTARDCPHRAGGAAYRYLLCSTARCGSNLVSDMLHQTGMAGDPLEYLNGRYMAGWLRSQGAPEDSKVNVARYLADMESRRTTPNGHFGIKVHFEHLQALYKTALKQAIPFLQGFDRIILLRRRDKIAQAVSLHKARVTQIWSSQDYTFLEQDDPRLLKKAEFDPAAIGRALADILVQEFGWVALLKSADLPFEELWYEDFVQDYTAGSERLLRLLDIPEALAAVTAPTIKRQGADDDPMTKAFRQVIGV